MGEFILVGSRYFFGSMDGFKSKNTDYVLLVDEPRGFEYVRQTSSSYCLFEWKRMKPISFVEYTLSRGPAMQLGKFLVPEFCDEIGFTLNHLKMLEPLVEKLDAKRQYEKVIYDAYLANLYATPLDDYAKRDPGVRYMVRYMDDMVIYGPSKRRLHSLRKRLSSRLWDMGLSMKGNWQVYKMPFKGRGRATDFIGYVFHRTHTTIRGSIWIHIRRALMRGRHCLSFARRFFSYYGYIRCTDSKNIYEKYIRDKICVKRLKEVISNETGNEISRNAGAGQVCCA